MQQIKEQRSVELLFWIFWIFFYLYYKIKYPKKKAGRDLHGVSSLVPLEIKDQLFPCTHLYWYSKYPMISRYLILASAQVLRF